MVRWSKPELGNPASPAALPTRPAVLPPRNGNGPIGSGLEDVRRALDAGAADLVEARRRMP